MLKWLFVASAMCQLLVAKTASTLWGNLVLKWLDAVLTKVKNSVSLESFMDLHNSPLLGSSELFPREAVEKAIKKSFRVLHDEAINKAMTMRIRLERCLRNSTALSRLFCSSLRNDFPSRLQGSRLGIARHRLLCLAPRLLPLLPAGVGERSFEGFLPPSQPQVGGVLARHWNVWQAYGAEEWTVEVLHHDYQVLFHHLPSVLWDPQKFLSCAPGSV